MLKRKVLFAVLSGACLAGAAPELNGVTVWSSEDIAKGEDVTVTFEATAFKPGLNELIWYYEPTSPANNWLTFDYHSLVFEPPPNGATFIVR